MNIAIGTLALWAGALWIYSRLSDESRGEAFSRARTVISFTLPRIAVALVGAGLIAELLPADRIEGFFGAEAGILGCIVAALLGPLTPGGAFVSFALASAALTAGAEIAPVISYITAWSLFSITKLMTYETAILGARNTLARVAVSWPVPLVLGLTVLAITRF